MNRDGRPRVLGNGDDPVTDVDVLLPSGGRTRDDVLDDDVLSVHPQRNTNTDHWGAGRFGKNDAGFQFPSFRLAGSQLVLAIQDKVLENDRICELQPIPIAAPPVLITAIHQSHRDKPTGTFYGILDFFLLWRNLLP